MGASGPSRPTPDATAALLARITAQIRARQLGPAFRALTELARRSPRDPRVLGTLGYCNAEMGRHAEAIAAFEAGVRLAPEEPTLRMGLVTALQRGGRHAEALGHLDRLIRSRPDDPNLRRTRASLLLDEGRGDEAAAEIARVRAGPAFAALGVRERAVIANTAARLAPAHRDTDETLRELAEFAEEPSVPASVRVASNWHMGRLLDAAGRHDEAFAAYTRSKRAQMFPWDPDLHARRVDALIECWREGCGVPFASRDGSRLVFITGMMRSGTSLTEQMLAQLDAVMPGGEMNAVARQVAAVEPAAGEHVRRLPLTRSRYDAATIGAMAAEAWKAYDRVSATSRFVTDKQPENLFFVPLIARMFPGCSIIHTTRDAVDTCLSNYFQAFGRPHPQTHDLGWLGRYYRDYARLMDAWRALPEVRMIDLSYEDLVRDPRTHLGRAMDFVGLDWDDRVLDFHRSDRAVRTSSRDQVRRPLYTSSVKKHEAYAAHLGPLLRGLGLE